MSHCKPRPPDGLVRNMILGASLLLCWAMDDLNGSAADGYPGRIALSFVLHKHGFYQSIRRYTISIRTKLWFPVSFVFPLRLAPVVTVGSRDTPVDRTASLS
jgi:hypothetical protein